MGIGYDTDSKVSLSAPHPVASPILSKSVCQDAKPEFISCGGQSSGMWLMV